MRLRYFQKKVGYSINSEDRKSATNVAQMVKVIDDKFTGMLFEKDMNEELWKVFENIKATPEQAHNLLSFREIGYEAYQQFIKTRLLMVTSVIKAPV